MNRRQFGLAIFSLTAGSTLAPLVFAGDAFAQQGTQPCSVCGEQVECVKVCKLKCVEKEVKFNCYKSEYEDICVPNPSVKRCEKCVSACTCKEGADGCGRKFIFGIWETCGAEVKTRRRLYRKSVTRSIPSYEWEVESRCHECCQGCLSANSVLPPELPQVPVQVRWIDISEAAHEADQALASRDRIPAVSRPSNAVPRVASLPPIEHRVIGSLPVDKHPQTDGAPPIIVRSLTE